MMRQAAEPERDAVNVRVPGDKSITHRALVLAALADGRSVIRRPLAGADTRSTAAALRALGVDVALDGEECVIAGVGLHGLRGPADVIDCGNSGTTARLLMGALAGCSFAVTLTGDASLRGRPMRRVMDPLALMGALFEELEQPDRLPVRMQGGALRPLAWDSPHASAQVKSAILLAGLTGSADVAVTEPVLSRDHTERMLERMGVPLQREVRADGSASVVLRPVPRMDAFTLDVPGDISSASFIAAFACLSSPDMRAVRIVDVGLNPARTGFLGVLRRMGAQLELERVRESCGEPLGDVVLRGTALRATDVGGAEVPSLIDEIPMLAVLAARAEGITRIEGAGELRVKESDRIHAIVANLTAIGVRAEELPDGLLVEGTEEPLAGSVDAHGDHRIAMAFGVLAATSPGIRVTDTAVADVSFPGFWELLRGLRHQVGS
jgi:3-phosphoshikimate 1-carboxyvinyltransferase